MKKIAIVFLATASVTSYRLMAQPEMKTKSISIFKDGKSFVIKEGKAATINNEYTLDKLPPALFGTFWFSGLQSDISRVISRQEEVEEPVERKANSFLELLYANKGKQVTLVTHDGKIYSGIVEDFDLPEEISSYLQLKEAELADKYNLENTAGRIFPGSYSTVLLLKMNSKWISIDPASVKSIEFETRPERTAISKIKLKKPVIKVHFTQGGQQGLNMMYLQDGISWTPVYRLELQSETEATLRLQAEVVNNVEDIAGTDVNFVVGVPNFQYAARPATLTAFLNKIRNIYPDAFSNAIQSRGMANYDVAEEIVASGEPTGSNIDPVNSEELYFYTVKDMTLEKGSRAHYPLFASPVKIRHLYECNLTPATDENYYRSEDNFSFDTKYSAGVYHVIEISNDGKTPFTTGPVLITDKEGKALAQDEVKYTGKGLKSCVKLMQAPDIRIEEKEKIIDTKVNARSKYGYNYNLVTVQSEVKIINTKNKDIELALNKSLLGKCTAATIAMDRKSKVSSGNINPLEALKFTTSVKANGSGTFTYTYEVYVRE